MNKKDVEIVRNIVSDCLRSTLAAGKAKKYANYFINGVPVIYQYEQYPLASRDNWNDKLIRRRNQALRGNKSVLDIDRREAYDAAKDFITYTIMRTYGEKVNDIPNLCLFPVPTTKDAASYYAEWNEVLNGVQKRTGIPNCMAAFEHHYRECEDGSNWFEGDGFPDGEFDQSYFSTATDEGAKIILVVDSIYQGTIVRECIDMLRDMGNEVILVISLIQTII